MATIKTFDATEKILSLMDLYKQTMDDIDFIIVQVPTGEKNILEWKEISISDFFKAAKVTGSNSWAAIDFKIVFKNHDFIRTTLSPFVDYKLYIEYIHVPTRIGITDSVTLSSLVFELNLHEGVES